MRSELEKEILKDKEKKEKSEKIDRDAYLEEIKKSIGEKKTEEKAVEQDLIEKLKDIEPLLGDTNLYGEIAAELTKLGGGKDLAGLFEKMILKMAEVKLESVLPEETREGKEISPADSVDDSEPALAGDRDAELDPIDVGKAASLNDKNEESEVKINWEDYTRKLEKKYDKK
jgi:SHS2 domain-containing protein